jgi:hypothetical protein
MAKQTRLTLRLDEDLYTSLVERATVDHRSLNREIAYLLRQALFPAVDADAYRSSRQSLLAMPRHTIRGLGRPPKK